MSKPARVTVAAAGHFMVQHDTIGPKVLARLGQRFDARQEVEVVDLGTSGLALLDQLRGQELLIVVDACVGLGQPGELVERRYDPAQATIGRETSVHQLGPLEALQIAQELYPAQLPDQTVLLLVDTAGAGDALLEDASERVVQRLDQLLDESGLVGGRERLNERNEGRPAGVSEGGAR
jgi:hydrogenase maturation protease